MREEGPLGCRKVVGIMEGKEVWKVEQKKVGYFIGSILPSSALLQLGPFLLIQSKLDLGGRVVGMVSGQHLIEASRVPSSPACCPRGLQICTTQGQEQRHAHQHTVS